MLHEALFEDTARRLINSEPGGSDPCSDQGIPQRIGYLYSASEALPSDVASSSAHAEFARLPSSRTYVAASDAVSISFRRI